MELNEMKQLWQQHDHSLQENNRLNKAIVINMLKNRSGNMIARMNFYEYTSLGICSILTILYVSLWKLTSGNTGLLTCYLFSLAFIIFSLCISLYNLRCLSRIDFGNKPVTESRKELEHFRLLMVKERVGALLLMPFMLLTIYVIINYWVHGINILEHLSDFMPRIIIAVIAGTAGVIFSFRKIYSDSIKRISENLAELSEFAD